MGIDNAKGIRIKQMSEYTASIALLLFVLFFSCYRKPEKTQIGKKYIVPYSI